VVGVPPSGSTTRTVAAAALRTPLRIVRGGGTTLWKRQVVGQRGEVDRGVGAAAGQQRRQVEANRSRSGGLIEVERLDAEAVPAEDQPAGDVLDDGEGEHAEEVVDAAMPHWAYALPITSVSEVEKKCGRGPPARAAGPDSCRCSR
jgi:hypothetical protein